MLGFGLGVTSLRPAGGPAVPPPTLALLADQAFASTGSASVTQALNPGSPTTHRLLIVRLAWVDTAGVGESITSVTYDGQAMTLVPNSLLVNGELQTAWYSVVNPPTGTKNLIVNFTSAVNVAFTMAYFEGASSTLGAIVTATGTGTSASVQITGASSANYQISLLGIDVATTLANGTPTGSQTQGAEVQAGLSPNRVRADTGACFVSGTATMSWTLTDSRPWTNAAFEVAQAV